MTSERRQSSPRIRQKRRQARQDILTVARDVLLEDGPDAVTLARVAGRLGMTKPALYHYFPSKEALARSLVTSLIEEEIDALVATVENQRDSRALLGSVIRAFHAHYRERLHAFRFIYCQSQLYTSPNTLVDAETVREDIAPRTARLFDVLEARMAGRSSGDKARSDYRRLAYTAWSSALGMMTILAIADATRDPLRHSDDELLETLVSVYTLADPTETR